MIEVCFRRGLFLPELDLWLDPWDAQDRAFVSHAHGDHYAKHRQILCSEVTGSLLVKRFGAAKQAVDSLPFQVPTEHAGFRMRLLPAGHISGSSMLHLTRLADQASLLYTGDFKLRRSRTAEAAALLAADTLIMETTFGLPEFVFPSALEVETAVLRFVHDAFADEVTPVLLGYSIGKAQEVIALLAEQGISTLQHPAVAAMTTACREVGVILPEPEIFEGCAAEGSVVIAPPAVARRKGLAGITKKRVAMLTGWASQAGARWRYRVDELIPLSDHADHPGLHECIRRVRPTRVLTVHGYAQEFAAELRARGIEAWSAAGGDQLELIPRVGAIGSNRSAGLPRQSRPICELADLSDLCRLLNETQSQQAKQQLSSKYLAGLETDEQLELAVRWLDGASLGLPASMLYRAFGALAGVSELQLRELRRTTPDVAVIARHLLPQASLSPQPISLSAIDQALARISRGRQSLQVLTWIRECLESLHPVEGELVVRLMTNGLQLGLAKGGLDEALASAIDADLDQFRRLLVSTGGRVAAIKALRSGEASELSVGTPFPWVDERDHQDMVPDFPLRIVPQAEGHSVQLHRCGSQLWLFDGTGRNFAEHFPELAAAAHQLAGDFVIEGTLVSEGPVRTLAAMCRAGRTQPSADLFSRTPAAVRLVIRDLYWLDGRDLRDLEFSERWKKLPPIEPGHALEIPFAWNVSDSKQLDQVLKQAALRGIRGLRFRSLGQTKGQAPWYVMSPLRPPVLAVAQRLRGDPPRWRLRVRNGSQDWINIGQMPATTALGTEEMLVELRFAAVSRSRSGKLTLKSPSLIAIRNDLPMEAADQVSFVAALA